MTDDPAERRRRRRRRRRTANICGCNGTETCPCERCCAIRHEYEMRKAEFAREMIAEGRRHTDELAALDKEFLGSMFGDPVLDPFLATVRAAVISHPELIPEIRDLITARIETAAGVETSLRREPVEAG